MQFEHLTLEQLNLYKNLYHRMYLDAVECKTTSIEYFSQRLQAVQNEIDKRHI